jgi:hypothetical protein
VRRLIGAVATAVELLTRDPGSRGVRLKTGRVIIERSEPRYYATFAEFAEALLAPERFVPLGAEPVPSGGLREVNQLVEERWTAVPRRLTGSVAEIAKQLADNGGAVPIAGHRVVQSVRVAGKRGFAHLHGEDLRQHLLSIGVQTNDDATYCGYYPTIKGDDVAHHDPTKPGMQAFQGGEALKGRPLVVNGKVVHDGTIRGGTEIRGGRAEYRRVLHRNGYEAFDNGYWRDVDRIRARLQAERDARHETELARRDALLPRKIGEI